MRTLYISDYISAGDMSGNITGDTIALEYMHFAAAVGTVTSASTLTGDLVLQASNDGTNWIAITTTAISGNGSSAFTLTNTAYRYARLTWTRSGGSGTLNATFSAKANGT